MPQIDPHTGCEVMTMAEFWANEGEGAYEDFIKDEARAQQEEEDRYRNPEVALEALQEAWEWEQEAGTDDLPAKPYKVLDVLKVNVSWTFRTSNMTLVAKCECVDDSIYTFTLARSDYSGSWAEPPDSEVCFTWEK